MAIPLEQRCLTALQYLLAEQWNLNSAGSVGWYTEEGLLLAAPRFITEMRAHMIKEGHKGLPERNTRYYDLFAEHNLIENSSDGKSVIKVVVRLGDWSQALTVVKFKPAMVWGDRERPSFFEGEVEFIAEEVKDHEPLEDRVVDEKVERVINESAQPGECSITQPKKNQSVGERFLDWLTVELRTYQLKINEQDALVHVIAEGLLLTTPKIFQKFAAIDEVKDFSSVQKSFQKLGIHQKGAHRNFFRIEVRTDRKVSEFNAYLIPDSKLVLADLEVSVNRHLKLVSQEG